MQYRVRLKLNMRSRTENLLRESLSQALRGTGLSLSESVPGLFSADGVTLEQLGAIISRLGEIVRDPRVARELPASGLVDDLWLHVERTAD